MTNLSEAVARAICIANHADPDEIIDWGGRAEPRWMAYKEDADAAIAAVLEAMETVSDAQIRAVRGRDPAPD